MQRLLLVAPLQVVGVDVGVEVVGVGVLVYVLARVRVALVLAQDVLLKAEELFAPVCLPRVAFQTVKPVVIGAEGVVGVVADAAAAVVVV